MSKPFLLFDFDGVLVDSFSMCFAMSKRYDPLITEDVYRSFFNGNIYEKTNKVHRADNNGLSDSEREYFVEYTKQLLLKPPVEGMEQVLKILSERYSLVIVTSSINSAIEEYTKKYHLAHYFTEILGVEIHKSKVEKMRMVMEKYQLDPARCLFITDTLGDMLEAQKVDIESVGVTWGFHDAEHLKRGEPMGFVHQPSDLPGMVDRCFANL